MLNRATGPTGYNQSSFELLEQVKPKILPLQPFGCRAVAVRPRHSYSKTAIDSHGVPGINLGRSQSVVNAYRIWIPTRNTVMLASDVYFDATLMPWRPADSQRVGPVIPVAAPPDSQASGPVSVDASPDGAAPLSVEESYDLATRSSNESARKSKRVLVLFSGAYSRPDGLGAFLKYRFGLEATLVDNDQQRGGNSKHDLLDDSFYYSLLDRVRAGEFCCIFAAPPCST